MKTGWLGILRYGISAKTGYLGNTTAILKLEIGCMDRGDLLTQLQRWLDFWRSLNFLFSCWKPPTATLALLYPRLLNIYPKHKHVSFSPLLLFIVNTFKTTKFYLPGIVIYPFWKTLILVYDIILLYYTEKNLVAKNNTQISYIRCNIIIKPSFLFLINITLI